VTSADCAPRVPYCSVLGYCHGGTLPFFEDQLDIADDGERENFGGKILARKFDVEKTS
jgi:hypothetical protein